MNTKTTAAAGAVLMLLSTAAQAAEWSDTALSWRYGKTYREPFNPNNIRKTIVALTHASGYKYGTSFFNVDMLMSDHNDPGSPSQHSGAQEAYVLYRNTVDIGKVTGQEYRYGPVKGVGATFGFDWNTKNDVNYNSRKRLLVVGPTLMWDVPGFLNTSILLMHESNAPSGPFPPISDVHDRYTYETHPMLSATWGIPVAEGWLFEGFLNYIAAKGTNETGAGTGAETNLDMQIMYDVGTQFGQPKNRFRIGFEYQLWNNKFGNTEKSTSPRGGNRASTPMVRAEYHF
jgi:nucleoside-specific outer membrane channel protein Tsx